MSNHLVNGEFVAIPLQTLECREWNELKGFSRAIYMTMAIKYRRTGKEANGHVKWSHKELVSKSGIPSTTLKRRIKELKAKGFVAVWMPGGRWYSETEYIMVPQYIDGGHI